MCLYQKCLKSTLFIISGFRTIVTMTVAAKETIFFYGFFKHLLRVTVLIVQQHIQLHGFQVTFLLASSGVKLQQNLEHMKQWIQYLFLEVHLTTSVCGQLHTYNMFVGKYFLILTLSMYSNIQIFQHAQNTTGNFMLVVFMVYSVRDSDCEPEYSLYLT